ncbi:hypothetical protein ACFLQW_02160 [Candidatus Zixiibacteriota bacterium]
MWAALLLDVRPGVPSPPCNTDGDQGYDGISPDHFVCNASGAGGAEPVAPEGRDILTIDFDVNTVPGQFEFDTACFTGSLAHLYIIDNQFPPQDHSPHTIIDRGIITITSCLGALKGDLNNDGGSDPLDMVYMINYVYRMTDNFVYPEGWGCPYELGDTDCNGKIDPVDVINLGILIYRGLDAMCDPCYFEPSDPGNSCG